MPAAARKTSKPRSPARSRTPRTPAPAPAKAAPQAAPRAALDHIAPDLHALALPLAQLEHDPLNAREHPESNRAVIRTLLGTYRQVLPLVGKVMPSGRVRVYAGNARLDEAAKMGWPSLAVVRVDWPEEKCRAFALGDNRVAELATWGADALHKVAAGIDASQLASLGFTEADLLALTVPPGAGAGRGGGNGDGNGSTPADPRADAPPPAELPLLTQPGDLWLLGNAEAPHRLLCGDATDPDDVERLLAGAKPGIMVTDPPYGVEYDPAVRNRIDGGARRNIGRVKNDDVADWREAWKLFPGDVFYCWHSSLHAVEARLGIMAAGFEIRAEIVWVKPHFVVGQGHYHWQHEPCVYAVRAGATAAWIASSAQATVWPLDNAHDGATTHGTQKPLACMERPLLNHGHAAVYDPFVGSGTTILAAERARRRCYALDHDPKWVDAAVARFALVVGKPAVRVRDGKFENLTELRNAASKSK